MGRWALQSSAAESVGSSTALQPLPRSESCAGRLQRVPRLETPKSPQLRCLYRFLYRRSLWGTARTAGCQQSLMSPPPCGQAATTCLRCRCADGGSLSVALRCCCCASEAAGIPDCLVAGANWGLAWAPTPNPASMLRKHALPACLQPHFRPAAGSAPPACLCGPLYRRCSSGATAATWRIRICGGSPGSTGGCACFLFF
jgi:hypothetical protein